MAINLSKALSVARSQLGYREGPRNNEQKYSPNVPTLEWSNFQPWCATFTCWVFLQAGGVGNTDFPLTASCLQQVAWGKSRGRFFSSPKVGDLIMIGPGGGTHVEIVTRVSGGTVWSIGGNTSGSWGGNYANGNGVYEKSRSASSAYGYVRPFYGSSGGAAGEDDMPEFQEFIAGEGQTVPANQWETVAFEKRDGKSGEYWSVVMPGHRAMVSAFVALSGGLRAGDEAQIRAALYKETGGISLPGGVLKRGATGSAVKKLQNGLKKLGYSLGSAGVDGDYGPATQSAVRAVQKDAGILVDGEYGPNTRKAMEKMAGPKKFALHKSFPIAQAVQSGGSLHLNYAIPVDVPKGYRLRVRVVTYGGGDAKVVAARCYVHSWKR